MLIYQLLKQKNEDFKSDEFDQILNDAKKELDKIEKLCKPKQKKNVENKKNQKGKQNQPQQNKKKTKPKKQEIPQEYIDKVNSQKLKRLNKGEKINVSKDKRNILITSALPYVNNEPHLGNLIGAVLSADVYSRFCRLMDYNSIYICGTDEYGTATETKALLEKKTPREICDYYNKIHNEVYEYFDIDFDYFGRTSTEKHTEIVQEIFNQTNNNGYMVPQEVQQAYCKQCQRFLADRFVKGNCPFCDSDKATGDQCDSCQKTFETTELVNPSCFVCNELVSHQKSDHLFLDLLKIEKELKEFFDKNSQGNWTNNAMSITKSWFKDGLRPRCITRDLKWGVKVPLEEYAMKCFYVWFDAPIGYISITASYLDNWKDWWQNPDNVELVQFMGKDNVPFHTIFFPATLLSTKQNWTFLNHISTTEYLNYENTKFSKRNSTGVFGSNVKSIPEIPLELWRFYLLFQRPENSDSQFKWNKFKSCCNNNFGNNIGNLVQRVLSLVYKRLDKKIPSCPDWEFDEQFKKQRKGTLQ